MKTVIGQIFNNEEDAIEAAKKKTEQYGTAWYVASFSNGYLVISERQARMAYPQQTSQIDEKAVKYKSKNTKPKTKMETKLYTIGHSNKTLEQLVNKLVESEIDVLVDVRTVPYSKYNPHFGRESVAEALRSVGIKYVYRGKNLGGKGGKEANTDWGKAIDELFEKCATMNVCVMCSEADPNDCHRQSTIQPDFEAKGGVVQHILWSAKKSVVKGQNGNVTLSLF